jgi:hypothetical protein
VVNIIFRYVLVKGKKNISAVPTDIVKLWIIPMHKQPQISAITGAQNFVRSIKENESRSYKSGLVSWSDVDTARSSASGK